LNNTAVESHPMAVMQTTMECASPLCVHCYAKQIVIDYINVYVYICYNDPQ